MCGASPDHRIPSHQAFTWKRGETATRTLRGARLTATRGLPRGPGHQAITRTLRGTRPRGSRNVVDEDDDRRSSHKSHLQNGPCGLNDDRTRLTATRGTRSNATPRGPGHQAFRQKRLTASVEGQATKPRGTGHQVLVILTASVEGQATKPRGPGHQVLVRLTASVALNVGPNTNLFTLRSPTKSGVS